MLPPGPSEPRLAQLAEWIARPVVFATRQRDRYGEAFTANIEPHPWVMLGDPDDVRAVFTAGPQRTNAGEANAILRPTLGSHSLLLLDGQEHLRQRKLMLPAFHGERIERYRQIMREATERAVASWRSGEAFALRPHTQAITFEVIVRAVFGVDDAGLQHVEREVARARADLQRALERAQVADRLSHLAQDLPTADLAVVDAPLGVVGGRGAVVVGGVDGADVVGCRAGRSRHARWSVRSRS